MKFKYNVEKEKLILTESTRTEHHQLNLWLTRFVKGYQFSPAFKRGWNGKESYFNGGQINIGLWKECKNACDELNVPFILENKEDFPIDRTITLEGVTEFCKEFFKDHKYRDGGGEWKSFMPFDYQIESAYKILKNRYCITEVTTSGGKSLIISIVYFYRLMKKKDSKILIIVPNLSLVTQFYDNIMDFNLGENLEYDGGNKTPLNFNIEEIMSAKPRKLDKNRDTDVYIGTFQSLDKKDAKFFKQFDIVVVDESHKASGATIKKILKKTVGHAFIRFGVSGTFPPENSCESLTIQSVLGPKVVNIGATKLIEQGTITPMDITSIILNHNNPSMQKRLKSAKNGSNGSEIYNLEKKYFQESEKRLEFIFKLTNLKCNGNTMILFNTIEHGKKLYERFLQNNVDYDVYYIDGEVKKKDRDIIITEMNKTDRKKILISSYQTTATGLSIKAIINIILADSYKSESMTIQAIGRALRKHKEKKIAYIYDLVDIFTPNDMSNTIYKQYLERESFYKKRDYPFRRIKTNL